MNTANSWLLLAALAGRAAACDITGWPSTSHHPNPVATLPAAEIIATYTLTRATPEEYMQVVRAAVRTATGDALATLEPADRGLMLAVHLTRVPADWPALDQALRDTTAGPARKAVTVSVRLHADSLDRDFRQVANAAAAMLTTAGSCRLDLNGGVVVVTFPAERPPTPAGVWRLRKAASAKPAEAGTS